MIELVTGPGVREEFPKVFSSGVPVREGLHVVLDPHLELFRPDVPMEHVDDGCPLAVGDLVKNLRDL